MTAVKRPPEQARLRALLVCAGTAAGAAWGAIGTALTRDERAREVLTARGGADGGDLLVVLVLLIALPLGSLAGAPALDLLSHVLGRRPAILVSCALAALGAIVAAPDGPVSRVVGVVVVGLGMGGYAIVVPKLAHELAERGHRRLMPRVRATAPAGAGLALLAAALGSLLGRETTAAWMTVLVIALVSLALAASLPETPHWHAAHGRIDAAHAALRRMHGPFEAAVGIDWVMMDAGMLGEQHPLNRGDLRISRVRRTVVAGLLLELVQVLPLGLAAFCLGPLLVAEAAGTEGARGAGLPPLWSMVVLAVVWGLVGLVGALRRGDRLAYAWIMGGTALAAGGVILLALLRVVSAAGGVVVLLVVMTLLVIGQYVAVVPACTGGIDPFVPPWLLRSQRRAGAAIRPLVQIVALVGPALLMALVPSPEVAIGLVLGCQILSLLIAVAALPRAMAALR